MRIYRPIQPTTFIRRFRNLRDNRALKYWPTPIGRKTALLLEECGLEYRIHLIDISAGDQFKSGFLTFSPSNRTPAIIDTYPADGSDLITVSVYGAILLYRGEKTGNFLPTDVRGIKTVTEWLTWMMGGMGPMAGQNHHFAVYAPEKLPYAIDRYVNDTNRLYGGVNRSLDGHNFISGNDYSISDLAAYPWVVPRQRQQQNIDDFPNLQALLPVDPSSAGKYPSVRQG
jgi:GST-like protein